MRIVYLDFDGVIVTIPDDASTCRQPDVPVVLGRDSADAIVKAVASIDRGCVARVDRLCREIGAQVVVSSNWRRSFGLGELRVILKAAGLSADVVGVTPQHGRRSYRGAEIAIDMAARFRCAADVVILDDDDDMEPLGHRLIRTEMFGDDDGFNDEALTRALALFDGGEE